MPKPALLLHIRSVHLQFSFVRFGDPYSTVSSSILLNVCQQQIPLFTYRYYSLVNICMWSNNCRPCGKRCYRPPHEVERHTPNRKKMQMKSQHRRWICKVWQMDESFVARRRVLLAHFGLSWSLMEDYHTSTNRTDAVYQRVTAALTHMG